VPSARVVTALALVLPVAVAFELLGRALYLKSVAYVLHAEKTFQMH
jgi:hypothetical protein